MSSPRSCSWYMPGPRSGARTARLLPQCWALDIWTPSPTSFLLAKSLILSLFKIWFTTCLPPPTSHSTPRSLPVWPPHLIHSPECTGMVEFFDKHCLLCMCLCYEFTCPVTPRPLDLGVGLLEVSFWEQPPLRGCKNQAGIVLTCPSHCSTILDDMVPAPVQGPSAFLGLPTVVNEERTLCKLGWGRLGWQ